MKKRIKTAAKAVEDFDAATAAAVKPYRETPPVRALSLLSKLGDQPPMRAISAAVIALGLARDDRRLARAGLRMLAAHTLATIVKDIVKRRVDRTRPRSHDGGDGHRVTAGRNSAKEETSFPSGHAAGAAAVAAAFAREFPEHRTAALAGGAVIALAQIPRSAHYVSDIGSGVAIGLAAETLVNLLAQPADGAAPVSGATGGQEFRGRTA